jgi:hypothetical protein
MLSIGCDFHTRHQQIAGAAGSLLRLRVLTLPLDSPL